MSRVHLAVSIGLVGALLAVAAPARAATGDVEEGRHCVYQIVGERPTGEFVIGSVQCFDTFSAATFSATGGSVRLPADMGPDAYARSAIVAATFTLGIHYDYYNGAGTSKTVVGSSCSGGYWNTPSSFSNRISSSYNGCRTLVHYDDPGMGGSSATTVGAGQVHNLTWFNNRTESIRYLP